MNGSFLEEYSLNYNPTQPFSNMSFEMLRECTHTRTHTHKFKFKLCHILNPLVEEKLYAVSTLKALERSLFNFV